MEEGVVDTRILDKNRHHRWSKKKKHTKIKRVGQDGSAGKALVLA